MPSSSPGIVIHLEFTLEIIKQPGIKVQDSKSNNLAQEGKVHVCCGELPIPALPGVLHITLHVLACHRAILGSEMILWEVTEVFVVELESLVPSATCQWVPDGRCPWPPLSPWGRMKGTCSSLHKPRAVISKPGVSQQGSPFSRCSSLVSARCWQRAPILL